jgi:hypothetical protein
MITQVQFKRLDSKGIRPFSVTEDVTKEILTSNPQKEGITRTFRKGGKFFGEPVEARIQKRMKNGNYVRHGQGKGFMVVDEDGKGCWILPAKETSSFVEEEIVTENNDKTLVSDIQNDVNYINNNPEKKVLGFTYKQIAIVAILVLIARKL